MYGERRQPLGVLFSRLKNADTATRRQVVRELGEAGGDEAAKVLTIALRDGDRGVRDAAHWALLSLDSRVAAPLLMPVLADEDMAVRSLAMETLIEMGPGTVPSVIPGLTHPDGAIRELTADILRAIGPSAATEALIVALEDEDPGVVWSVIEALGAVGDPRAVGPLIGMFEQREDLRPVCAEAMGRIGDPSAVPTLKQGLQDRDPLCVFAAVEALGQVGDERCVDDLIALLENGEAVLGAPVMSALFRISERCGRSLWSLFQDAGTYLVAALRSDEEDMLRTYVMGELEGDHRMEAVVGLVPFFGELDRNLRERLVQTIGDIGARTHTDVLHAALSDEDLWVAYRATQALERVGDGRSVPPLIEMLRATNPLLRIGAARALGAIGDRRALEPLSSMPAEDSEVCEAASHAIERIQTNAEH